MRTSHIHRDTTNSTSVLYLVDAAHRVDEDVLHTVAQIRKISLEGKHQLLLVLNKVHSAQVTPGDTHARI